MSQAEKQDVLLLRDVAQRVGAVRSDRARLAAVLRMTSFFTDMVKDIDRKTLEGLPPGASEEEVLLAVYEAWRPRGEATLRDAELRGIASRNELLAMEGGCLPSAEFAARLGVSRQAVDKRRKAGRLIAVPASARGFLYPAWQVHDGRLLPGLEQVLAVIGVDSPVMQLQFFVLPHPDLEGKRPLDLLRAGKGLQRVVTAAYQVGRQGAR